jgi:hypothetical protein
LNEEEFDGLDAIAGSLPENSVMDSYLAEIQEELRGGKLPSPYKNKTFWVQEESASFVLVKNTDPKLIYRPRVFLWLPHHLKKDLVCPDPKCKSPIEVKAFQKNPRARRIIDQNE